MATSRRPKPSRGELADGMLLRVSEIVRNTPAESFEWQQRFVAELLDSVTPTARAALAGLYAVP